MMLSVFAGSLVSGLAGFAFSAVAGAILLHWVAPSTAVPLLLACSITTQLLTITTLWRSMRWRQCAPFLIGGVIGIPLGAKMLKSLDAQRLRELFSRIFLIAYSSYMLLRPKLVVVRRYLPPISPPDLPEASPAEASRFRAPFPRSGVPPAGWRSMSSEKSFSPSFSSCRS